MAEETLVLFKNIRNPKYSKSLEGYKKAGGYQTLKKVFGMKPEEVVQTVKDSLVRGRKKLASQVILLPTLMNLNLEHARTGN